MLTSSKTVKRLDYLRYTLASQLNKLLNGKKKKKKKKSVRVAFLYVPKALHSAQKGGILISGVYCFRIMLSVLIKGGGTIYNFQGSFY